MSTPTELYIAAELPKRPYTEDAVPFAADKILVTTGIGLEVTAQDAPSEYIDNTFRIKDNLDTTKKIAFQASGVDTGTTKTITMPNRDVDLGGLYKGVTYSNAGVAYEIDQFIFNGRDTYRATSNFTSSAFGTDYQYLQSVGLAGYQSSGSNSGGATGSSEFLIGQGAIIIQSGTSIALQGGTIGYAGQSPSTLHHNTILNGTSHTIGTNTFGSLNTYHNTIINGVANNIGNPCSYALISGGISNSIIGNDGSSSRYDNMTIVNGESCLVKSSTKSTIVNGRSNSIIGCSGNGQPGDKSSYGFIGNGSSNTIKYLGIFDTVNTDMTGATIVNGASCYTAGKFNFIGTGDTNRIGYNGSAYQFATHSFIGNGTTNRIANQYAFIGTGTSNLGSGPNSFIGAGTTNTASGSNGTVVNGLTNTTSNTYATVVNGTLNIASGLKATVLNGNSNTASKPNSTVINGETNTANGGMSVILTGNNVTTTLGGAVVQGGYQGSYPNQAAVKQSVMIVGQTLTNTLSELTNCGSGGNVSNAGDTKYILATKPNGMSNTNGVGIHEITLAGSNQATGAGYFGFSGKYIVTCSYNGTTTVIDAITTVHTSLIAGAGQTFTPSFTLDVTTANAALLIGVTTTLGSVRCAGHVESVYS